MTAKQLNRSLQKVMKELNNLIKDAKENGFSILYNTVTGEKLYIEIHESKELED